MVFLRADREGDIDRPCAGWSRQRYGQKEREKEGERRCNEERKGQRAGEGEKEGPMDRRGTASASSKNASPGSGEVLGPARFSRVRSALGKVTFFFAVLTFCVLSGPYVVLSSRPRRVSFFFFYPLLSYPFFVSPTADRLRGCARLVFNPR